MQTLQTAQQLIQAAMAVYKGASAIGRACYQHDSDMHQIQAEAQRFVEENETDSMEEGVSDLQRLLRGFTRIMRKLSETQHAQAEVRLQAIQTMA